MIATLFSLLVSFTLTPLLAAKWSVSQPFRAPKWLLALDNGMLDAALCAAAVVMFVVGNFTGWSCSTSSRS